MKEAAPVGPAGTFSEADWKGVRESLAVIGIDLNTARISAHFEARSAGVYRHSTQNHPWLSAGPEWRLCDVLQRLAHYYTLPKPRTAKQWSGKLGRARVTVEKAAAALRLVGWAPANFPSNATRSADATKDRALHDLLAWKVSELSERIAELQAIDSRSQSALTEQTKYWRELTALWRSCGDGKLREAALRRFLLSCSRAPFAETSTEQLEDKIDSFLINRRRKPGV
jgi:hypothetical protein